MSEFKYSAKKIAELLRESGVAMHDPTEEQAAIIESWPLTPSVVIAGAGSGKTETMSARVLWLVANGLVRPDEVLGLTFTRKAAGELAIRIRTRLRQLRTAGLLPHDSQHRGSLDIAVQVATYHSYAGRVLSEHSIRMGIDSGVEPIGEAAAWQIANTIVKNFDQSDYRFTSSLKSIVESVMDLSAAMGEHSRSAEEIRAITNPMLKKFASLSGKSSNKEVRDAIEKINERLAILPMVEAYDRYRFERGLLTFNDQMSLAATLVEKFPDISSLEKSKYKVVLLDEYQDTSYSQVRFLSALFGQGHGVTAVGDPHQAIYGWRSASSQTLATFAPTFIGPSGATCNQYSLLTTWRNDARILDLANRAVDEINLASGKVASVGRLALSKRAGVGELLAGQFETMEMEAIAVADHIARYWFADGQSGARSLAKNTCAVLVRTRKYIEEIESALRARGIPVEVVGLGGLIHVPEVADILALLRTLTFPDSGSSLLRLLTGPRLNLGPRDLAALGKFTRNRSYNDEASSRTDTLISLLEQGSAANLEADDFAVGSAIESLELLDMLIAGKKYLEHGFSDDGFARLVKFAAELRLLRRYLGGSITDAILEAERFLSLDTEVLVRDGWQSGRKHLDAFLDEASKFQRNGGTLFTFLEWLKIADKEEGGLKPTSVDVSTDAVQILTIHAAKGSEWDCVAVPGLVARNFPSSGKASDHWLKDSGALPIELRGDSAQLHDFEFPRDANTASGSGATYSETKKALEESYRYWNSRRHEEELRLAYVAFTRAKSSLLCTSSWFVTGAGAVDPSELYIWAAETAASHSTESLISIMEKPEGKNPTIDTPRTAEWPRQISIESTIRESAELVRGAKPFDFTQVPLADEEISSWASDATALINESAAIAAPLTIALPDRLSVSTLIALSQNPEALALSLRRPMPNHIDKYARRGTEFHLWVEKQFTDPLLFGDEVFDSADPFDEDSIPLKELQDKWLASAWGSQRPIAVEVPFETVLAGTLLRGRIDAVYRDGDKYEVVDWKTGRAKSGDDLEVAAIQLAMYRLAYSKLYKIELSKISAAFHYIGDNQTVRPADLYDEAQLTALITKYPLT